MFALLSSLFRFPPADRQHVRGHHRGHRIRRTVRVRSYDRRVVRNQRRRR